MFNSAIMFDDVVTIDFESRSACDLKKAGACVYSEHPTTDVLCLWFAWQNGDAFRWLPGDPIPPWLHADINGGMLFECHSSLFERFMMKNQMIKKWGWPEIPPEQWHDTQAVCARKALPLALGVVSPLLGLKVVKNEEGSAALKKIMKPVSKKDYRFNEDPKLLDLVTGDYGRDDTLSQMYLSKRLGYLEPQEREIWLLNQRMNMRGLRIDLKFAADCQAVYDKATKPIQSRFADLTDNMKPGSPFFKDLLNEMIGDADCKKFPNMTKDVVTEALKEWNLPDEVRTLVEMRKALTATSVKKLKAMRACTANDGRAHGLIQYHAATTGRDGGRLLQPLNFPRGTVELGKDADGKNVPPWEFLIPAIQTRDAAFIGQQLAHLEEMISPEFRELLAPVSAVSSSLRSCMISDPGKLFVAGDYSTIEVRVLLAMAGQHDKLDLMRKGGDPYCDMASRIYKQPVTKANMEMRQTGKNSVLGLGFQMGAKKFLFKYGKGHELDFCKEVVSVYRDEWAPEVPKMWEAFQEAALKAVVDRTPQETYGVVYAIEDEWLTCRLHSGRKLYYFQPRVVTKEMPWSTEDRPDFRQAWTYRAMKSGRLTTVDAYGGLLVENAVQGTARDIMYDQALVLDAEGFPLVLTVYDENVTETWERDADPDTVKEIMEDASNTDWVKSLGIPIAAECWAGDRYRK